MAAGKAGIVWSGTPPVAHGFIGQAETELSLTAGLHLVEIPEAGYRQGIEVIRDETFTIGEKGTAVAATPGSFALLSVDAGDPTAGITVVRADFETVFAGRGGSASSFRWASTRRGYGLAANFVSVWCCWTPIAASPG